MSGARGEQPVFDFTHDLEAALEHAPLIELTDSRQSSVEQLAEHQEMLEHQGDDPDNRLTFHLGRPLPYQVTTRNQEAYPALLEQAAMVFGKRYTPEEVDELAETDGPSEISLEKSVEHELEHAAAIRRVSPRILIDYGVQVMLWAEGGERPRPVMGPFVSMVGWLRKIDLAYVTAAPSELSEGDLMTIRALGYESPEEIKERFDNSGRAWSHILNVLNFFNKGNEILTRPLQWSSRPMSQLEAQGL